MGIDCSGNSLMGLGRCHFTSAITKRSPLMMVDLWKPKPKGKNRNRNSLREEARRQAGRRGRNCVSCSCWLPVGDYLLIGNRKS
jgi:hypothetical protein